MPASSVLAGPLFGNQVINIKNLSMRVLSFMHANNL